MLKHHDSSAIVAVSDLARARAFYSDVLGLELDAGDSGESGGGEEGVLTYRTGATRLVVHPPTRCRVMPAEANSGILFP